jgi:hypothetical protein
VDRRGFSQLCVSVEIGFQIVMRRHFVTLAAFLVQPHPPTLALRKQSSTCMVTTGPIRAKAKVIIAISARSGKPTKVHA